MFKRQGTPQVHPWRCRVTSPYIVGMDVGQVSDPSAVAVLGVHSGGTYDLIHLDRLSLGMGYPNQVRTVVMLLHFVD